MGSCNLLFIQTTRPWHLGMSWNARPRPPLNVSTVTRHRTNLLYAPLEGRSGPDGPLTWLLDEDAAHALVLEAAVHALHCASDALEPVHTR